MFQKPKHLRERRRIENRNFGFTFEISLFVVFFPWLSQHPFASPFLLSILLLRRYSFSSNQCTTTSNLILVWPSSVARLTLANLQTT